MCNNGCWALGEIAIRYRDNFRAYIPTLLPLLWPIIASTVDSEYLLISISLNCAAFLKRMQLYAFAGWPWWLQIWWHLPLTVNLPHSLYYFCMLLAQ